MDNLESSDIDIEFIIILLNGSNGIIGFFGLDNMNIVLYILIIIDDDCLIIFIGGIYVLVLCGIFIDGCCMEEIIGF